MTMNKRSILLSKASVIEEGKKSLIALLRATQFVYRTNVCVLTHTYYRVPT